MWASSQPTISASETAYCCVKNVRAERNMKLRTTVIKSLAQFDTNSYIYRAAAANDSLHTVNAALFPAPGGLPDEDMERLYDNHLAESRTAYPIYHQLRRSGPGERCTYCRNQTADSLDHFIPKKVLPALSIEPWNLVPCCTPCNRNLSNTWETDPSRRRIHPYFMPELNRWLHAAIVDDGDVYPVFRAEPKSGDLDDELCSRILAQFEALNLRETLGSIGIQELQVIQHRLRTRFEDEDSARAHLLEQADELFELDANSLRGVLYEATALDDEFVRTHLRSA
jgi:hypothetical protein